MINKKDEKVNQPDGAPIAPEGPATPVSDEVLSHQWQKDSPALNTNVLAGYDTQNLVEEAKAAEEAAKEDKKQKKEVITQEEYDRRTKLDVSDKNYINPSLDHYEVK